MDGGGNLYHPLKQYLWYCLGAHVANLYNVKIIDGVCWGFRQPERVCYFVSCLSSVLRKIRNQSIEVKMPGSLLMDMLENET